jgi:tellurite resistance protein
LPTSDIFKKFDHAKLNQFLGKMTQKVYDQLPCENGVLTQEGFKSLIQAAKKVLSADLQKRTYQLAIALAGSDGSIDEETIFLEQLKIGFGIDPQTFKKAA